MKQRLIVVAEIVLLKKWRNEGGIPLGQIIENILPLKMTRVIRCAIPT